MKRFFSIALVASLFLGAISTFEKPADAASVQEDLLSELTKTFSGNHTVESSADISVSWNNTDVIQANIEKNLSFRPDAWEQHSENNIQFALDPIVNDPLFSISGTASFSGDAYGSSEQNTLWAGIRNIDITFDENTTPLVAAVVEPIAEFLRFFEGDMVSIRPDDYRFLHEFFSQMGSEDMNFDAQADLLQGSIQNPSLQSVHILDALLSTGLLSVETTRDGFRVTLSSNIDEIQAEDFADLLQFFGYNSEETMNGVELYFSNGENPLSFLADSSRLEVDFIRGERGIRFINTTFVMSIDLPEEAIDANITLTGNTRIEQTSPEVVLPDFSRAIRFEKLLKALEIPQLMMGGSSSEEETFLGDTENAIGLAQCLNDSGAVFYGTEWCSHCADQKALFGNAFEYVVYVDCGENEDLCQAEGIVGYPTWKFADGSLLVGTQSLYSLAEQSNCTAYAPY